MDVGKCVGTAAVPSPDCTGWEARGAAPAVCTRTSTCRREVPKPAKLGRRESLGGSY